MRWPREEFMSEHSSCALCSLSVHNMKVIFSFFSTFAFGYNPSQLGVKLSKCWISFVSSFRFLFLGSSTFWPLTLSLFLFPPLSISSLFHLSFFSLPLFSPSLPLHIGDWTQLGLCQETVSTSLLGVCFIEIFVLVLFLLSHHYVFGGLMLNEYAFINTVSSWCVNLHFILKCLFSSSTMSESLVILSWSLFFWC